MLYEVTRPLKTKSGDFLRPGDHLEMEESARARQLVTHRYLRPLSTAPADPQKRGKKHGQ